MSKAKSTISSYWIGFRSKKPFSIMGLGFVILSLIAIPSLFYNQKITIGPYEKYNYEEIVSHGERKNARITGVMIKNNVTSNGINPRIISYEYIFRDSMFTDKFQTLEVEQVDSLSKKDSVNVFVWNGKSVISKIKPYTFPMGLLWCIPILMEYKQA